MAKSDAINQLEIRRDCVCLSGVAGCWQSSMKAVILVLKDWEIWSETCENGVQGVSFADLHVASTTYIGA